MDDQVRLKSSCYGPGAIPDDQGNVPMTTPSAFQAVTTSAVPGRFGNAANPNTGRCQYSVSPSE
jgi:hypothetical protein